MISIDLTPEQASARLREELAEGQAALHAEDYDSLVERFSSALVLALQMGSAAIVQVLRAVLTSTEELARRNDTEVMSTLSPALIGAVSQLGDAGGLPSGGIMAAWAIVVTDVCALLAELGLVFTLHPSHRAARVESAFGRANLLDEATADLFGLTRWLGDLLQNEVRSWGA